MYDSTFDRCKRIVLHTGKPEAVRFAGLVFLLANLAVLAFLADWMGWWAILICPVLSGMGGWLIVQSFKLEQRLCETDNKEDN